MAIDWWVYPGFVYSSSSKPYQTHTPQQPAWTIGPIGNHDLALIASALAAISEAVARADPHYQTLDRERRLTDALNAMAKRLGA